MEWKLTSNPTPYKDALAFMEARVNAIAAGTADDCTWLLEHPPLYTAGTSAKISDLLEPRFPIYETGRGGEYTYHGPGQRVGYVMLNLRNMQQEPDIKKYIWQLEEWIIQTLHHFDVKGERREGRVGIWVQAADSEKKIAAIGVRVRHWVTFHGIAINNTPDLSHFSGIVPCGIQQFGVTSLSDLGKTVSMAELDAALMHVFPKIFA